MTPEPLKGKEYNFEDNNFYFSREAVKDAVEWLKEKLDSEEAHGGVPEELNLGTVLDLIDEAFEDVTK
jgi:hypothetical protein